MITLKHIYIYPIKSLGGISLSSSLLTGRGLLHDRRWMIVDGEGTFITQRQVPEMALLQLSKQEGGWEIQHKSRTKSPLSIPFDVSEGPNMPVRIFNDSCTALRVSREIDQWFQEALGQPCHLVYMPDEAQRQIDLRYAKPGEVVSFADGYPYLLIGQASLDGLNERLSVPVSMNRFRPNLVITGSPAHAEDHWEEIQIGEAHFGVAKPCARCAITTVDQETGIKGKEPLYTLSTYRKSGTKVLFGQNLLWRSGEKVSVGEKVNVSRHQRAASPR